MAKVNYGKVQYKDKSGVLAETKNERVYLSGVSQEDFTKIAGDGGNKVYFEGVKKGISLSMEAGNEVLASVKGLKGKDFMEGLSKAVVAKYGDLGEKGRVDFTSTVYFKDGVKTETKEPDLIVFNEERLVYRNGENISTSPVTIFEFKRPKRKEYPDNEKCHKKQTES